MRHIGTTSCEPLCKKCCEALVVNSYHQFKVQFSFTLIKWRGFISSNRPQVQTFQIVVEPRIKVGGSRGHPRPLHTSTNASKCYQNFWCQPIRSYPHAIGPFLQTLLIPLIFFFCNVDFKFSGS